MSCSVLLRGQPAALTTKPNIKLTIKPTIELTIKTFSSCPSLPLSLAPQCTE